MSGPPTATVLCDENWRAAERDDTLTRMGKSRWDNMLGAGWLVEEDDEEKQRPAATRTRRVEGDGDGELGRGSDRGSII
ncbi:hypothetical protein RB195_002182 [Necator americanus]|uniref:Uncharacterized protein n=1 Tax=Necator americanus TaxID=51031 RepID=A0ABR1DJ78_NECAM